jgi:hypothetical protein
MRTFLRYPHGVTVSDTPLSEAASGRRQAPLEIIDDAPGGNEDAPGGHEVRPRPELNLSELVVGGAVLAVALLAWGALALAHLGWFSLGSALGVWAVALAVVAAGCWRWARVRVRVDRTGCLGVVALAAIAAFMVLPGFHYGVTDKDPGAYVAHAMSIARTGSYEIIDPTLDGRIPGGPVLASPGARFPAVWERGDGSDVIVPQFYHLWPALLAVSDSAASERGIANTAPLLGILAILAAALALRRAVAAAPWGSELTGLASGAIAGLLFSTNMLEVWQAKYPSSEISAQMLFIGALLGLVLALTTGWRPAAGAAGLLVGVSFLDRGDGVILVLLAAAALAVVIAARRWDSRATWFAVGLGVVLPHAFWQAYSYDAAGRYSAANSVPSLPKLSVAIVALLLVGAAVRPLGPRVIRWVAGIWVQRWVGLALTAVAALLVALGFLRSRLFGASYELFARVRMRSFDDQIMQRLSWFVSVPGFALMLLGIAVVALRRWGGALWVLAAPLFAIFPVYGYKARNSTRLMWWTRRYLPTVLPLVLMLIALALGVALTAVCRRRDGIYRWFSGRRVWTLRLAAVASIVGLLAFYLSESWPLRNHDEFGGSFAISSRIAADAGGKQGVFLWQRAPACCGYAETLFGAAIWLERNQISALLPAQPQLDAGYIHSFAKGFPGQPVFVVWHGQQKPDLPGVQLTVTDRVVTSLQYWEESNIHRPRRPRSLTVSFVVYRATVPG